MLCAQATRVTTAFANPHPRGAQVFTDLEKQVGVLTCPGEYLLAAGWSASQPSRLLFDLLVRKLGENIASRWQDEYPQHLVGEGVDGRRVLTYPLTTNRNFFNNSDAGRQDPAACMVPRSSHIIWFSRAGYAYFWLGRGCYKKITMKKDEQGVEQPVEVTCHMPVMLSCSRLACFLKNGKLENAVEDSYWDRDDEGGHACQIVRHLCFNPGCCNPLHVVWGTYWQNREDQGGYRVAHRREGKPNTPLFKWDRQLYAELELRRLQTDRGPPLNTLKEAAPRKRGRKGPKTE